MRRFTLTVALLAAVVGLACADDDDPEPPASGGKSLRALQGKWAAVQRIYQGKTEPYGIGSYTFDGAKVTFAPVNGKAPQTTTTKIDPKRPGVVELPLNTKKTKVVKYFFEVKKDKLYLTVARGDDPKAKGDFSGATNPVLVFQKGK